MRESLIVRWRDRLPLPPDAPVITLGEGDTPLVYAETLSRRFDADVWLKCEGLNPTGSFKDRGMTVAVTAAIAEGARGVVCASTGNTAASAAAYAARAGIEAVIALPRGAVAGGKLAQARVHGARIVETDSFGDALAHAQELAAGEGYVLVNSLNPNRLHGQKTAAFEILDDLGAPPDALALPYGGGGNTRAYALGFEEAWGALPRFVLGESKRRADTVASAIRIAEPAHRSDAEAVVARSLGVVVQLGDDEILAARDSVAREEGIYCEPASAAGVAALSRAGLAPGSRVVCVLTGHGLKDTA